jgi:hypothetical protein
MRVFVLLALTLVWASCATPDPHHRLMSDNEMIDLFQRERASFDSLATMLDEDADIGMLDSYARTFQSRGADIHMMQIPEARRAAYERLLRRVYCSRNIWSDDDGILMQQFVQKWQPNERDNWMRGFWYARKPLDKGQVTTENLLGDRDESPNGSRIRYRHLSGAWYLFTDHGYNG